MKRRIAVLLAALMMVGVMTGYSNASTVLESYSVEERNRSVADGDSNDTITNTQKTTTKTGETGENVDRTIITRPAKEEISLPFTPVADIGAKYDIKGTVSIAVKIDTARPTDYAAMFDTMQKLYPNIDFVFDYWALYTYDDGREYLNTRFKLGTNANIIWDETGSMPTYTENGYVYPITDFVKADPEAKNIPANLISDYTYAGELYALPHQANFELVAFNLDLLQQTGLALPKMEWSMKDYEKYLKAGANLFNAGKCVAIEDLDEVYHRVSYYNMSKDSLKAGADGWNYDTWSVDVDYLKQGALQMRAWRVMQSGVEGWYEFVQRNSQNISNLQDKLGISNNAITWDSGKALMEDTNTTDAYKLNNLHFKWDVRPAPNVDGKNMYSVDHCFITSNTPSHCVEACFQALRFMTYSTNGNLARLSMYESSQTNNYKLNYRIYYPATQSKKVLDTFYALSCVTEMDKYLMQNIPKCSRYDAFKIVPYWDAAWRNTKTHLEAVTDGLKDGTNLQEPAAQMNRIFADSQKIFADNVAQVQAKFQNPHGGRDHSIITHPAKAPTCAEIGWDAYETCSMCYYTTYVAKATLDHDFGMWTELNEPTILQKGEERRDCQDCDYYETRDVPKLKPEKTGWIQVDGKWYYFDKDGEFVVNKWQKDSKGWVYLGADGAMLTNKWCKDSKGWCYVGADGYAVTNCWKKDSKGWIWLDANGSMTKAKWIKDNGKWYYLDANGYMVTNKWSKDSKGWVYVGSDGAMVTNKWVRDSKGWCYVGADGYAVTNCWKKDSKGWIYLNGEGSMTKSKWIQDGGKWYYLDSNGYMVANKSMKIGNKTYKFNAAGVCTNP